MRNENIIRNYPYQIGDFKVLKVFERYSEGAIISLRADPILVTARSIAYSKLIYLLVNHAEVNTQ